MSENVNMPKTILYLYHQLTEVLKCLIEHKRQKISEGFIVKIK